jgi:quercetin dioxygenase-like cupin family protein
MMHFVKAGDRNDGHEHNYDHITLLSKGKVAVSVNEQITEFTAPHMIFIAAGKKHYITALEDDTIASCLHALKPDQAEQIIDPMMIPKGL